MQQPVAQDEILQWLFHVKKKVELHHEKKERRKEDGGTEMRSREVEEDGRFGRI